MEWWSGGGVEWWSGGVVEWWSNGGTEWWKARPEGTTGVRLRVRTNNRVKVPIGQKHWSVRSGRQLRRREAGWRAA
jgi:hypothetical protein